MYNPMALYLNFRPAVGLTHHGQLYTKIFIMYFYAQNAVAGLYETETEDGTKKNVAAKEGYSIPQGVIHQALQKHFTENCNTTCNRNSRSKSVLFK